MPIEHGNLAFQKTNVTSWTELSGLFKFGLSRFKQIDGVFANAGITGRNTYVNERLDEAGDLLEPDHLVLEINLKAVINTTALAIHHMKKQAMGGSIVLTASASSFQRFRLGDYTTAKHGVLGLMRSLEPILHPTLPIRINAIAPSWTTTGLVPEGTIEAVAGIGTQTPSVVAKSVAVLFADDKRHGQLIYSVEGKYSEAEGTLLKAAADVVGEANEDIVLAKLWSLQDGALANGTKR